MNRGREIELEAELELSLLQINQLQEELEHYYIECSRLKEQRAEYSPALAKTSTQVLLTESRLNDTRYSESGFYEKSKFLISQVSELRQALEASTREKADLEAEKEALSSRMAELESNSRELESSLSDSQAVLEAIAKEKAGLEAEKEALLKEVSDTRAEFDREEHGYQEKEKWVGHLHCQVEELKEELKKSARSIALGQKMLAKSQIDMDHLRDSYAKKVASEQGLVELVNELRDKLTLASQYYIDLQKEHPEILLPIENT